MLCIYAFPLVDLGIYHLRGTWHLPSGLRGGQTAAHRVRIQNNQYNPERSSQSSLEDNHVCITWGPELGSSRAHRNPVIKAHATSQYPLIKMMDTKKMNNGSTIISNIFVEIPSLRGYKDPVQKGTVNTPHTANKTVRPLWYGRDTTVTALRN